MTKAEQLYADIIHMDRPEHEEIFIKYPRMPLQERAKIFSPFAALRGYDDLVHSVEEQSNIPEE